MSRIVQKEDPVLRAKAKKVPNDLFGTPKLSKIVADMTQALDSQEDGAAIAAPQIGVSLQIFVISQKVFGAANDRHGSHDPHFVFINPKLLKLSKKTAIMDEGCLSVRGVYGNVRRSSRATIQAYDEKGEVFTRGAGGLLAQVFQHETDHLNGILFIDKAEEMWEVEDKKI